MSNLQVKDTRSLENLLNEVDYGYLNSSYVPSLEALEFITFIKLVNGEDGEENKSPVIHFDMFEGVTKNTSNLFVSFRGSAKTTALHEYMYLFLATYGHFFDYGEVRVAMYISDTIDNGVKSMRKQLQHRWEKSDFLQQYLPTANFTDVRWEFINKDGHAFVVRGFGASTGVRGFKEYGLRPQWCGFDDLMSDKNAESPTIIKDIRNIIYKAARQAMHPKKRKIVWTGTPFNQRDPLYSAATSNAWSTKVYPICEQFPCEREEFKGAWEDRFDYDFVKAEYEELREAGEIAAFNQELMLRIMSAEDRLILDSDIMWYKRSTLLNTKSNYNFYITTDFATSAKNSADFSVIAVWALNSNGDWFLVDGVCKRQQMDANINELFRLVQMYKPMGVGVEVSGQQGGFIPWLKEQMMVRNCFFTLSSDNNGGSEGIRPVTDKFRRFNTVVPWFKSKKVMLPEDAKDLPIVVELVNELQYITTTGIKSKHDDVIDTVSMLSCISAWKPSSAMELKQNSETGIWEADDSYIEEVGYSNYLV